MSFQMYRCLVEPCTEEEGEGQGKVVEEEMVVGQKQ